MKVMYVTEPLSMRSLSMLLVQCRSREAKKQTNTNPKRPTGKQRLRSCINVETAKKKKKSVCFILHSACETGSLPVIPSRCVMGRVHYETARWGRNLIF